MVEVLILIYSDNTITDSLKKTLTKSKYSANIVMVALSTIKTAIQTLQFGYIFIETTKKMAMYIIKTSYFGSNISFPNFFKSIIWSFLVVDKTLAMI